jgi:iron complex transport system ATP-binding protein
MMIELKNISFSYYGKKILNYISLEISEGEFCGIIGPNGCGKTTLIRLLSRITSPECGEITLDGRLYRDIPRREFAGSVSYFPQGRPIPDMTAEELVAHGRFPHTSDSRLSQVDRVAINAAFESAECSEYRRRNLKELSFGERQRVYMAMLLAQDAKFAFLDEPTTYMDISNQFAMLKLLGRISGGGRGVVTVLHDISSALKFCGRIVVMAGGKIVFDGSPDAAVASGSISEVFGIDCRAVVLDGVSEYILTSQ